MTRLPAAAFGADQLPHIDGPALERALGIGTVIDALADAFGRRLGHSAPRQLQSISDAELLTMTAHDEFGAGVKLLTERPKNRASGRPTLQGVYVLFDGETCAPQATIDASALTGLRTAAVSGLATRYLARQESSRLVVFGAGVQAAAHARAMCAVREITDIRIVGNGGSEARKLAEWLCALGLPASVGRPSDVAQADLVCTCTDSAEPVCPDALLAPGTHINAIGAFRPSMRELHASTLGRATITVETRQAALGGAGDILQAIDEGAITEEAIIGELSDVVGGIVGRTAEDEITIFKSVGLAYEDLVVARQAVAAASGIEEENS